jgi:hypothetical protein
METLKMFYMSQHKLPPDTSRNKAMEALKVF